MTNGPVYGSMAHTPLGEVAPLLLPWVQDPWGMLRPPLSVEAMQMSAELACATYHMNIDPWMQAGWHDVTMHVDGELTPLQHNENWLSARWKKHRVRSRIRQQHNPIGQVLGALRQVNQSDTGKALVMLHSAPHGRYVLAVSFMGTGSRFYDWISNFRMSSEKGVHKGFLQLTRQFEAQEKLIEFPETAKELGLERLTLEQVLREMRHPNSRFILWLSGHSQGAALMQIYTHDKIQSGVLPTNIVGYGFASPTVMTGTAVKTPAAYPLYHILNSDDIIPRFGAQVHLGVNLTYPTDVALRRRCYAWPMDAASVQGRNALRPVFRNLRDSASCIETVVACLSVLSRCSAEDILSVLGLSESVLPLKKVVAAADVDALVRSITMHASAAYQSITGRPLDRARVADAMAEVAYAIDQVGIRGFGAAFAQMMHYPHSIAIQHPGGYTGSYPYIVTYGAEKLVPTIWLAGRPPRRVIAAREAERIESERTGDLYARRRETPPRRIHRNIRYRDPRPRTDTRHHTPVLQHGAMLPGERAVRMK